MQTEEEQVEKLKTWLRENGMSIVLGIVIGVGGLGGYRYWEHHQESQAQHASSAYIRMMDALASQDYEQLELHAKRIIDEHAELEYAQLARLALARGHVEQAKFDAAQQVLQAIVGTAAQSPVGYVARTRLAAVQLQQQQFEPALATLAVSFPPEFAAQVDELRGDIYRRQGNTAGAIEAYRKAQSADPPPANVEFLRQKLDNLGGTG
ncbi:MAG: tetratricopeptide repeat protein [Gammaproteobacteria bacterium]|nr:tetratricopeptide repeat protein [Gammaproteobacteria bacterium]